MELSARAQAVYPQWWDLATYIAAAKDASGAYRLGAFDVPTYLSEVTNLTGQTITFDERAGVQALFGIARTMEVKADRLTALADEDAITGNHISEAPYSRSLALQNASPMYKLVAEITYRAPDGSVITTWGTGFFPNVAPATAGAMRDEARLQFQRMLSKRDEQRNTGGELLSIGRTYLISV